MSDPVFVDEHGNKITRGTDYVTDTSKAVNYIQTVSTPVEWTNFPTAQPRKVPLLEVHQLVMPGPAQTRLAQMLEYARAQTKPIGLDVEYEPAEFRDLRHGRNAGHPCAGCGVSEGEKHVGGCYFLPTRKVQPPQRVSLTSRVPRLWPLLRWLGNPKAVVALAAGAEAANLGPEALTGFVLGALVLGLGYCRKGKEEPASL